ncbi:MAG: CDP-alcohol phosphatidyltransferase family protein [Acidobacteria bacterium]|nr:CDP-alcohol phosphatidyltransferase family protein [Acidobacteriota bacterium]
MPAIPNLITLARLFLTPYIVLAILNREYPQALLALIVAGISDGLDGYLARTFRWTTDVGAVLDPIADKILLCGIYLALGLTDVVPVWLMYVVFARDLLIALGAVVAVLFTRLRQFQPSIWGKLSTFLQILTAVMALAGSAFSELHAGELLTVAVRLTTLAAIWSCCHYYYRGIRILSRHPAAAPQA